MYRNQRDITGWEKNGCGLACLYMIFNDLTIDYEQKEIVRNLLALDGYAEGVGWKHKSLVRLLNNFDVPAYTQEFTNKFGDGVLFEIGINKLKKELQKGNLAIVSVFRNFSDQTPSSHLVLLTELKENYFIVQDPDYEFGSADKKVALDTFKKAWRGFCIIVEKHLE